MDAIEFNDFLVLGQISDFPWGDSVSQGLWPSVLSTAASSRVCRDRGLAHGEFQDPTGWQVIS